MLIWNGNIEALKPESSGAVATTTMTSSNYRAPHTKPPRGYCTQISRAISPSSRCYEHLLVRGAASNSAGSQRGWKRRSTNNRLNLKKIREPARDELKSGAESVYGGRGHDKIKRAERGQTTTIVATAAAAMSRASQSSNELEASREEEELVRDREEELVYVRLETMGSNLADLSTSVINEKLVSSLFSQLLVANQPTSASNKLNRSSNNNSNTIISKDIDEIRAQILSPLSNMEGGASKIMGPDKCRSSMEKFLCRLIYPSCHFRRSDVSALVRPPCREDCLLLKDVLCSNLNWFKFTKTLNSILNATLMSMINELDLENQGIFPNEKRPLNKQEQRQQGISSLNSSLSHFYWPHEHSFEICEMLPPLRSIHFNHYLSKHSLHPSNQRPNTRLHIRDQIGLVQAKWPICSNAYLTKTGRIPNEMKQVNSTTNNNSSTSITSPELSKHGNCLKSSDGVDYTGQVNITRSGRACQTWQNQWPHSHAR